MNTQNYVCPNCQGRGCPVCQNTGQVSLTDQEVQELQRLAQKTMPQPQDFSYQNNPETNIYHQGKKLRGQMAGIFTLLFLVAVFASGFLSWFYTKTFKPFFQFWIAVSGILLLRPVLSLGFLKEKETDDFIAAIQKEGIKVRLPFFFPFL